MSKTQNATSWSSDSLAGRWRHNFFYLLIKYTGRVPAYIFSHIVVFCYLVFSRKVYRRAEPYIKRRFPDAHFIAQYYHTWRLCQSFAIALIDKSAMAILGRNTFNWQIKNQKIIAETLKAGQGLILLTTHTGSWQSALGGVEDMGAPVHIMIHRSKDDIDSQYFEEKSDPQINIVPVDDPLASMLHVTKALQNNEIVSLMGDRIFPPTGYISEVELLGDRAFFPTAAYKIAQSTKAPVVMLLTSKTGISTMHIEITEPVYIPKKRSTDLSLYAQKTADVLERYIQLHPYQFYNFLDLWSKDHDE